MRKPSRGSTGRRRSRSSQSFHKRNQHRTRYASARRTSTQSRGKPRRVVRALPKDNQSTVVVERRRNTEDSATRRNEMPHKPRQRRADLRAQRRARRRLPATGLPVRRVNENASDKQTTRSVCTRKKQARRAVVIANGYGGRNNARKYRRHTKC